MPNSAYSRQLSSRRPRNVQRWIVAFLMAAIASGCHSVMNPEGTASFAQKASVPDNVGTKERELPAAESAKLCFATAEMLDRGGQFAEAISLYEKARQEDSRIGVQATKRLAVLHDRTGNFDKAIEEYQRGLRDNPKDAELYNNLGYGYYCRGEWESAETNLRKAIALDSRLTSAWNNLGMTLAQRNRYDESIAAFEKAVSKAQAHCNVGFIQATQGRVDEARRSYERALQVEPGLQLARAALQKLVLTPSAGNNLAPDVQ